MEAPMDWLIRDPESHWKIGDTLDFRIGGHLFDRGIVQEILGSGIYRVDLESGHVTVQKAVIAGCWTTLRA